MLHALPLAVIAIALMLPASAVATAITTPITLSFSTGTPIDGDSFPVGPLLSDFFDPSKGTIIGWSVRFVGTAENVSGAYIQGDVGAPVSLTYSINSAWSVGVLASDYSYFHLGNGEIGLASGSCSGIEFCEVAFEKSAPIRLSSGLIAGPLPENFYLGMGSVEYSIDYEGGNVGSSYFQLGVSEIRGTAYYTVHYDPVPEPSAALVFAAGVLLVRSSLRQATAQRRAPLS